MKKLLSSFVLVGMMVSSTSFVFADSGSTSSGPVGPTDISASAAPDATPTFSAAPDTTVATISGSTDSLGNSLGEYAPVSCSSNSSFAVNSCDQCFDGGSVKTGTRLTGIFDNFSNGTPNFLVTYKDEQKSPNMVKFGNTVWTTSPADESKIFLYGSDVQWVTNGSGGKMSFMLNPGQKVKFYDADLSAGYTLTSTDKKTGDLIGMLRFPVVSHSLDVKTAAEGAANTHYECVSYKLDAPASVTPTPGNPTPAKPVPPKGVTQTQTGPETLLLIAAAFFIAFGMMFALRRRV